MINSQELANNIKMIAKSKKISIGKMLKDCDLSINTLSSMQSGGYYPRLEPICKIADKLDVSVDFLLGRTNIQETEIKNAAPQYVKRTVYSYEGEDGFGTEEHIFDKTKAKPLNDLIKSARTLSAEQINLLTAMAKNMKENS